MKHLKRIFSLGLAMLMTFTMMVPSYAANKIDHSDINGVKVIEGAGQFKVNYTEQREDGLYYISEYVNGNTIDSKIYKVENGEKILSSTIVSNIKGDKVFCIETNSDGKTDRYEVRAKTSGKLDEQIQTQSGVSTLGKKKYLRTEKYGISLVGKKVTIAIAAAAIVAATAYISLPVAVKIITSAIAAGAGAGVTSLPDYLYVTSDVYTSHSVGKIYTRYENKYYLDSARTQYVGLWTFSKRWGH